MSVVLKARNDCVGVRPVALSPLWSLVKNTAQAPARTGCEGLTSITLAFKILASLIVNQEDPKGQTSVLYSPKRS